MRKRTGQSTSKFVEPGRTKSLSLFHCISQKIAKQGGTLGVSAGGLVALVATAATPIGWVAAATLLTSQVGGAVIGAVIGDKVEGPD